MHVSHLPPVTTAVVGISNDRDRRARLLQQFLAALPQKAEREESGSRTWRSPRE